MKEGAKKSRKIKQGRIEMQKKVLASIHNTEKMICQIIKENFSRIAVALLILARRIRSLVFIK